MHGLGSIGRLEIVARWLQRLPEPGQQCARSALPRLARYRHRRRPRPEPAAEKREEERRVGAHSLHLPGERGAVARRTGVEGRDVACPVPRKQHVRAIGTQDASRQVAVSDRESTRLQILADRAVRGRGEEQHQGRRHHVVQEPGRRDLLGAQTAADTAVAIKDKHLVPVLSQHAGCDQSIDAAANNDIVRIGHTFLPAGIVSRAWAGGSARNESQRAHRRSRALHELQRGCDQDGALRWQKVEMAKARQAVAVRLMHERVGRERRIHASR